MRLYVVATADTDTSNVQIRTSTRSSPARSVGDGRRYLPVGADDVPNVISPFPGLDIRGPQWIIRQVLAALRANDGADIHSWRQ